MESAQHREGNRQRVRTEGRWYYVVDGIVHYCVANMPGAVPHTATVALTNATLPYVRSIADLGWRVACHTDPGLGAGLTADAGQLYSAEVAQAHALLAAHCGIRTATE